MDHEADAKVLLGSADCEGVESFFSFFSPFFSYKRVECLYISFDFFCAVFIKGLNNS